MSDHEENLPAITGLSEQEFLDAAADNEEFGRDEVTIPFLLVLQPLSFQIQEGHSAFIPGAKPGMYCSVSSGKLYDGKEGIIITPIHHEYNYTEWVPRDNGGGFIANWADDEAGWQAKCDPDQRFAYQPITREGNVILKARHFFVFIINPTTGEVEACIFKFAGTSLKVAKQWSSTMLNAPKIRTSMGMKVPAYHYYTYHATTEMQKNSKGAWFIPRIVPNIHDGKIVSTLEMPNGRAIWESCNNLKKDLREGTIKAEAANVSNGSGAREEDAF